jgi:hypothetical protein
MIPSDDRPTLGLTIDSDARVVELLAGRWTLGVPAELTANGRDTETFRHDAT